MNIPSISSTQSQSVSGLIALQHTHHKKALNESPAVALIAPVGSSTTDANPLASAIAAQLTQLGLTFTPNGAGSNNTAASSSTLFAPLAQQPRAAQQVQQYTNVASTFSNLAQALNSSSSSTPSTSSGASSLSTVFQNLWTSLSSSSGTSVDSSDSAIPALPLFMQTLARNFSESGISGLRGVFVDTVV
jgi:hypothetical protein